MNWTVFRAIRGGIILKLIQLNINFILGRTACIYWQFGAICLVFSIYFVK